MPKAGTAKCESLYGVHPGVAMVQKSMMELKEKTGRSLEEWIAIVQKDGPKDEKSRFSWLKAKHKLGMNRAGWIAERADVKGCPCKTIVPLYRNHVFAQIKPTTHSRIDLGFALTHYKGKLPKRLIDTGGLAKKDRITHRIEITSADQIDDDVKKWLKTAYDLDA